MKTILSYFCFLVYTGSFAQLPGEYSIKIKATTATPSNEFKIDVLKSGENLKIVYYLRDSVSYKLDLDQKYRALNDLVRTSFMTASRDSLAKLGAKLDSFRSVYTFFSKDSLLVPASEVPAYIDILTRVNKTGNIELTNASANAARNQREGPMFEFKVISPTETRVVYAQYPTASTNPLLYQLVTESMKLYRENKKNGWLSKMRTNSY